MHQNIPKLIWCWIALKSPSTTFLFLLYIKTCAKLVFQLKNPLLFANSLFGGIDEIFIKQKAWNPLAPFVITEISIWKLR